ncbi:PBECR4 domain-containing protein [Limosilactobacillus sp.]|uniref:PBECR4 domain-containing protein n=1 Tax=Limosilactobacillus sp. TaxID=2773925 RepID=UPI0025C73245|nr:PBECR4 domain-containing protein [Limosilactobacillus sp.]MCI2031673.1 PBECR4 domain-containing protein [Limosilactobacillus sp.]
MNYYHVNNTNDINYKCILDDYHHWFSGRIAELTTNYKMLSDFKVIFSDSDLPHLMGWQKVVNKRNYAGRIIMLVKNNELTIQNSRKHHNSIKIKSRILNYNFLHEIFWENDPHVCVMTSDMKPNPLKLDIVFFKKTKPREIVVLGLRRAKGMKHFVPTTLHTESSKNNSYLLRRKTSITSIKWLPRIN